MGFPCEWRSFPATILVPVHLVRDNLPKISLRRKFLRSVTPSLVAWMALLVPSQPAATTICVVGLITALVHFSLQQCINWNDMRANLKPLICLAISGAPGQRLGPARLPGLVPWPQPRTHLGRGRFALPKQRNFRKNSKRPLMPPSFLETHIADFFWNSWPKYRL